MDFPKELKYTKDHEWLRVEENEAYIGITDFAQNELGDIVFVDVDSEGEELEKEAVFGSVEAVKTVPDLLMPMDGKELMYKRKREESPELINTEPYNNGWIVKISISDMGEVKSLLDAKEYKELVG